MARSRQPSRSTGHCTTACPSHSGPTWNGSGRRPRTGRPRTCHRRRNAATRSRPPSRSIGRCTTGPRSRTSPTGIGTGWRDCTARLRTCHLQPWARRSGRRWAPALASAPALESALGSAAQWAPKWAPRWAPRWALGSTSGPLWASTWASARAPAQAQAGWESHPREALRCPRNSRTAPRSQNARSGPLDRSSCPRTRSTRLPLSPPSTRWTAERPCSSRNPLRAGSYWQTTSATGACTHRTAARQAP